MKTKKQRKITTAQVRALEKKLIVLEHRRCHIVSQTTPLKIVLRKYIQQNSVEIQKFVANNSRWYEHLCWALRKIKRGYFADATLRNLIDVVQELKKAGL